MVSLLPSNQASCDNEGKSLETSHGLFLGLNTQLSGGTNNQNCGSVLSFGDRLVFNHLIEQRDHVGQSFTAPCGSFDNTVLSLENINIREGLDLCKFGNLVLH